MAAERVSDIPYPLLMSIQQGAMAHVYKGRPTLKNPFDLALYPRLLAALRPRTLIEIGSHRGGSALWFADELARLGVAAHIHSVDIERVADLADDRISFHKGDARVLSEVFSDALLAALPRPWLVIDDADHHRDTVLGTMEFFDTWLAAGDYLVIEDGILSDMRVAEDYDGGPLAAIHAFLAARPGRYAIDRAYCDYFGRNVTWNVDGYLRRR